MAKIETIPNQKGTILRLARAAGIHEGEDKGFSLLFGQSFFLGMAVVTYYSSANALFLSNFNAQMLPYVYIAAAGIIIFSGLVFLRLQSSLPFSNLLLGNLGLIFLSITVLHLLLAFSGAGWISFIMLVWTRVLWVLGNLGLWTLAGRLFTGRQGKRLFSLIMAGGVLSVILVGLISSSLIRLMGTLNLQWITSASLFIALWILVVTTRQFPDELGLRDKVLSQTFQQDQPRGQTIYRSRYTWFIFLFTTISTIGTYVLDYVFVGQAGVMLTGADQLSKFFGSYMGISTLVTLIFLLLVSNRFLKRFGVRGGLLLDPLVVALGTLLVVVLSGFPETASFIFWVVVATKLSDEVTSVGVNNTALRILYQPLSQKVRSQVQTTAESVVAPLSMGISGLLLLLFSTLWSLTPLQAIYILAVILVGWLLMGFFLGRQYFGALKNALDKRYLDGFETEIFKESTSLAVLERYTHSDDHRDVLFAIEMLASNNPAALETLTPDFLAHPEPSVRLAAIQHLPVQGKDTLVVLKGLAQDTGQPTQIRAAALERIGSLELDSAVSILSPFLTDPDIELRQAAVVGALKSNTLEGILKAGEILITEQNDPSPKKRCFAARVIASVGNPWFYRNLLPLLNDQVMVVRREALHACCHVHHPHLWPLVIEALQSVDTRAAARQALYSGGEHALPHIAEAFDRPASPRVIHELIQICGKIGGGRVNMMLKEMISIPDEHLRSEVLCVLAGNKYQADENLKPKIIQQIDAEITALCWITQLNAILRKRPSDALQPLHSILVQMIDRGRLRVLNLLAMIYDSGDIRRVQANLLSELKEKRANATEILDLMLSQDRLLREQVVPIVTAHTTADLEKQARKRCHMSSMTVEEELKSLYLQDASQFKNHWLAACVLYALPEIAPNAADAILESALNHQEWMIHQVAQGVLHKIRKTGGGSPMMLPIEKVLILKTVSIFSETPDDVLAELTPYIKTVEVPAGQTIFNKGDPGDRMYIIVSGRIRVHDGERTLNLLQDRDVFGEMALLDPAPRSASVTAIEDTLLLFLDHGPFYEAVDTRTEIARGVIRVLSRKLRRTVEDFTWTD